MAKGATRSASRGSRKAVVMLLLLAIAFVALASLTGEAGAHAASPKEKLAELGVRPEGSMEGYSREGFPHWSDAREYGWKLPAGTPDPGSCDAREAALIRDGTNERVESGCSVSTGRWFDPYTGNVYHRSGDIDIDHVVALAEAYRSGASGWGAARRERFANVARDLRSVEDNANASKGDRDPAEWKPPRKAYWCAYSKKWIGIKHYWGLSVDRAEKETLLDMLSTCRAG